MELVNATEYKKEIKKLYNRAFPRNERTPFFFWENRLKNTNNRFYAALDKGEFIGLVYTVENEKMVYVFYLAIIEEKQGNGYGSEILSFIKKKYSDRAITLAIEDTADINSKNYEQRINRLGFYKRNGFRQLDIRINEIGVVYEVLGTKEITKSDFMYLMKKYWGAFLYKIIYMKMKLKE